MRKKLISLTLFLTILVNIVLPAKVFAGTPYNAYDVLGQTDSNGNPSFTSNDINDGEASVNRIGFRDDGITPELDTINHRLFISDTRNCRILVYNLDTDNNLLDRLPDNVIGQPNFTSSTCTFGAGSFDRNGGISFDSQSNRLFVSDTYANCRVLVFDTTTITDGESAVYSLGASDPSLQGSCTTSQSTFGSSYQSPQYDDILYDPSTKRLYAFDGGNLRLLIFSLSSGITNGMNASWVLGTNDFTSLGNSTHNEYSFDGYYPSLALDSDNSRLFVGDYSLNRVMVFDVATIINGEAAVAVLGKISFSSSDTSPSQNVTSGPVGLGFDPVQKLLFVSDDGDYRILIFDVNEVTTGENAIGVIGASDFVTDGNGGATQSEVLPFDEANMTYDSVNRRMYYGDDGNARLLIFNFAHLVETIGATVLGSAYSQSTIDYSQGTTIVTVSSGSLPPGISLNSTTGQLSGTPTTAGTYSFTLTLIDDNGLAGSFTDSQSYTLSLGTSSSASSSAEESKPQIPMSTVRDSGGVFSPIDNSGSSLQRITAIIEPYTFSFDAYLSSRSLSAEEFPLVLSNRSIKRAGPIIGIVYSGGISWQVGKIHDIWYKAYAPHFKQENSAKIIPELQNKPSIISLSYQDSDLIPPGQPNKKFDPATLQLAHSFDGSAWKILPTSVSDPVNKTVAAITKLGGYYMIVSTQISHKVVQSLTTTPTVQGVSISNSVPATTPAPPSPPKKSNNPSSSTLAGPQSLIQTVKHFFGLQ